jgi:hypothetical protein
MVYTIYYKRNLVTKNFEVELLLFAQTIVLLPGFFEKKTGVSKKAIEGWIELEVEILEELGFKF